MNQKTPTMNELLYSFMVTRQNEGAFCNEWVWVEVDMWWDACWYGMSVFFTELDNSNMGTNSMAKDMNLG